MKSILLKKILCFIFTILCIFSNRENAQAQQQKQELPSGWLLKAGYGVGYSGIGLKGIYEYHALRVFASMGVEPPFKQNSHLVNGSFNIGGAFMYQFIFSKIPLRTRFGIYGGWLGNYYDYRIGNATYNPSVYGLSAWSGIELFLGPIVIDADLYLDPNMILNKDTHPYYSMRWSPSLGIGININSLIKTPEEKAQKSYDSFLKSPEFNLASFKKKYGLSPSKNIHNGALHKYKSGFCNTSFYFQQLDTSHWLVCAFNNTVHIGSTPQEFNLSDTLIKVYFITDEMKTDSLCIKLVKSLSEKSANNFLTSVSGTIRIIANRDNVETTPINRLKVTIEMTKTIFKNKYGNTQVFENIILKNLLFFHFFVLNR